MMQQVCLVAVVFTLASSCATLLVGSLTIRRRSAMTTESSAGQALTLDEALCWALSAALCVSG